MKLILFVPALFLFSLGFVYAQADTADFNISVLVGDDLESPSTSTLLSAIPVAVSQIDLLWTAATDNFSVDGYNVFRDGVPIATTTLLNYSDTGLASSTLYTYSVRAFDVALNYSSTSNSIATSTLSPPIIPPQATTTPSTRSESTAARVVLEDLSIELGFSTTSMTVKTTNQARLELRWGRTGSYELGYVVSGVYRKNSTFFLSDLEPGTTYEYEIVGYSPFGLPFVLKRSTFTTNQYEIDKSPPNVLRFNAIESGGSAILTWQLPLVEDIAKVRVVRSHFGFPEHPANGAVVYEGLATRSIDADILNNYSPVYYTAFVYDIYGNISSGAVARVYASSGNIDTKDNGIVTEPTIEINQERVTPDMKMPELSDIYINQNKNQFTMLEAPLELDSDQSFSVQVPSEFVSNNLKSIIVTVVDPTNNKENYSFLLRINKDRSDYEAVIPALRVSGRSQIILEVFDYEAYAVATYKAPVFFLESKTPLGFGFLFQTLMQHLFVVAVVLFILAASIFWFFILKRRRTEDNNQHQNS